MKYRDDILFCGNGAGFQSCEANSAIFRAFVDSGVVPGYSNASSGSALFTSLFYSKGIEFIEEMIANHQPTDFVEIKPYQAIKTPFGKSNYLMDNEKIKDLLEENMNGNASLRVKASVTKLDDWSTHMKSATPGFALAATSIPFIFKPVRINGELWGDGGIFNNIPTPSIEETKKWKHVFVFVAPQYEPYKDNSGIWGLLNLLNAVFDREFSQLKESGFFDLPNVTLIQPESAFGGGLFKWSDNFKLQKRCYELTMEKLSKLTL